MNANLERMMERDALIVAAFTKRARTAGEVAMMLGVSKSTIQTAIKRNPKIEFYGPRDDKYCTAHLYCVGKPSAIRAFEEYPPVTQAVIKFSAPEKNHAAIQCE